MTNSLAERNARQAAEAALRRDELAELIANGSTIDGAATEMGIPFQRAKKYWQHIRNALGEQAV